MSDETSLIVKFMISVRGFNSLVINDFVESRIKTNMFSSLFFRGKCTLLYSAFHPLKIDCIDLHVLFVLEIEISVYSKPCTWD